VVGEHEDEAHRFRHRGCHHPAHHLDNLQGLHVLVMPKKLTSCAVV
jgi:hypothetical protein